MGWYAGCEEFRGRHWAQYSFIQGVNKNKNMGQGRNLMPRFRAENKENVRKTMLFCAVLGLWGPSPVSATEMHHAEQPRVHSFSG